MSVVVEELVMLAFCLPRMLNREQDLCKDAEIAREEQGRLNRLLAQAESDRERAAINRRRRSTMQQTNEPDTHSQATSRVSSLFGLSVQPCSKNKINVKPMAKPKVVSDEESSGDENEDRKSAAVPSNIFNLPFLEKCNVCLEENLKGYNLACGHSQCVQCMRKLFKFALEDSTMLPLRCCEVLIDMNIANDLLDEENATLILKRVEEKVAKKKMHCPSCSSFINLDLIDSSQISELRCDCGTVVCTTCKTKSHPGFTCRQNQAIQSGSDDLILELSRQEGWKQCPKCSAMIELRSGCNHMTCINCSHQFCYRCLRDWDKNDSLCASSICELWEEDRNLDAGEARFLQEEAQEEEFTREVRRLRLYILIFALYFLYLFILEVTA